MIYRSTCMPNQERYRMGMPSSHESSSTSINISGNSMMTEEGTLNFYTEKGDKRKKISHLWKTAQSKISTAANKASNTLDTTKHSTPQPYTFLMMGWGLFFSRQESSSFYQIISIRKLLSFSSKPYHGDFIGK